MMALVVIDASMALSFMFEDEGGDGEGAKAGHGAPVVRGPTGGDLAKNGHGIKRLRRGAGAQGPDEARVQMAGQMVFADFKIASMGIDVSDEALAAFIRDRYKDPSTGQSRYKALVAELTAIGAREEDMLAMERRGMGQSVLADILSIPEALITPREAVTAVEKQVCNK